MPWGLKLAICLFIDFMDFTIGRLLFFIPFLGEIIGTVLACVMFGSKGLFYALEAFDPTEQIDGFVPTATIIALASKDA